MRRMPASAYSCRISRMLRATNRRRKVRRGFVAGGGDLPSRWRRCARGGAAGAVGHREEFGQLPAGELLLQVCSFRRPSVVVGGKNSMEISGFMVRFGGCHARPADGVEEEFAVAVAAGDRRANQSRMTSPAASAAVRRRPRPRHVARVAHDAAPLPILRPDLELRLDQRQHVAGGREQRAHCGSSRGRAR